MLAPDTVVPPFAVFGGVPGTPHTHYRPMPHGKGDSLLLVGFDGAGVMVRELPPSAPVEFKTTAAALFATAFAPSQAP